MTIQKINPYLPCPCGSGRKYKFCCYEKEQEVNNEDSLSLIKKSATYPVDKCLVNESWKERGLATLFIVRQLPNSKFIVGVYLVDLLCLGVKDTFCHANVPYTVIEDKIVRSRVHLVPIDYEDARSMFLGGIEFARQHGFDPHPDWKDSQPIVEPEKPFVHKYKFGMNGKPMFIQGPHDDMAAITSKLR